VATVQPFELRKGDLRPDEWRVAGWRDPEGWHSFRWPNGAESSACPDCWPEVERRAGSFVEQLRAGVKQWIDPLALCARPGCGHERAAHVGEACSTLAVGCSCSSFVEPARIA
jgi:hypothetical protein